MAAFARLGMGDAADAQEAVGRFTPAAIYEPAISSDEADARLESWRTAAEATQDL